MLKGLHQDFMQDLCLQGEGMQGKFSEQPFVQELQKAADSVCKDV